MLLWPQNDIPGLQVLLLHATCEDVKGQMERSVDDSALMLGTYILCNIQRHNGVQIPAWHFLEENDIHCPALLGGNCHSEVSVEPWYLCSLKRPELLICLHLTRDGEVMQDEGVIPLGLVVVKEHGVVYLRHKLRRVCGVCHS